MADGGNNRQRTAENGVGDAFIVEGRQVVFAAAAATENDDVNACHLTDESDHTRDFAGRLVALDATRAYDDIRNRPTPREDLEHVAKLRSARARHERHAARKARHRLFALGRKITELGKFL